MDSDAIDPVDIRRTFNSQATNITKKAVQSRFSNQYSADMTGIVVEAGEKIQACRAGTAIWCPCVDILIHPVDFPEPLNA